VKDSHSSPEPASPDSSSRISDMGESERITSLEDGSDGGEMFASERSLQGDLGGIVLGVLPELRALNFRSHGVEDKHRICLHVGACEDVKSRFEARGLLIFRTGSQDHILPSSQFC
jgi:hypothetical protein